MNKILLCIVFFIPVTGNGQEIDCPQKHNKEIVLIISPDSTEIDSLKNSLANEFYPVAEDAMYYRSKAFELLKKYNISYTITVCEKHEFLLEKDYQKYQFNESGWYLILWNGHDEPKVSYPIDLFQDLDYFDFE